MRKAAIAVTMMALLAACSGGRGLRDLGNPRGGPDEFSVQPSRTLELPTDLSLLPEPTPGGTNRTDADPQADAIAALGGRVSASAGVPASDSALVGTASRYGVTEDIRAILTADDERFRKSRGRFSSGADRYYRAYAPQALDAYAEFERLRALGARVPSAPPAN